MAEQRRPTSLHPAHSLPDELWALVLSKCTWDRSWQQVKEIVLWRPGAARCLLSRPDLLAQMLCARGTSTGGLERAALHGRVDVAKVLLAEYGAAAEWASLRMAVLCGQRAAAEPQDTCLVELLLDHGARASWDVLRAAVYNWQDSSWHWRIVELLLDAGGAPAVDVALSIAIARCTQARRTGKSACDEERLVRLLLGRTPSAQATMQALVWAASVNFTDALSLILGAGVDAWWIDQALARAALRGSIDAMAALVNAGAGAQSVTAALMTSASMGHAAAVTWLLERGADVHADGDHALEQAVDHSISTAGCTRTTEVLLEHGADASTVQPHALVALAARGYCSELKQLVRHGAAVPAAREHALISTLLGGLGNSIDRHETAQWLSDVLLQRGVHTRAAARRLEALLEQ